MRIRKLGTAAAMCAVAAGLAALGAGTTPVHATNGGFLSLSLCAPASQTFTTSIDNTYSPFPPGASWHYSDGNGNTTDVTVESSPTSAGDIFHFSSGNVRTLEVTESDHNADGTFETSENWYAQSVNGGTVCYFGEAEHDQGSTSLAPGSWRADDPGRGFAPGIAMPRTPQVGMKFQEEFAPGTAEDQGEIVGIDPTDTVNGHTYSNVIRMLESDKLSSGQGHDDTKLFAPNVGAIRDETLLLLGCSGVPGC